MKLFSRELIPDAPDISFESPLWAEGLCVAGLDEAGRGAWAGPVTAAAVIFPRDPELLKRLEGVRDSKQVKSPNRERLAAIICDVATAWGVGSASNTEIDMLGIISATRLAMVRALERLSPLTDYLLLGEAGGSILTLCSATHPDLRFKDQAQSRFTSANLEVFD